MKWKDWSIHRKLMASHLLMIGIPAGIVLLIALFVLWAVQMGTGFHSSQAGGSLDGYRLQLMLDSYCEEIAHENAQEAEAYQSILEQCGAQVWVDTQNLSDGIKSFPPSIEKIVEDVQPSLPLDGPVFYWNGQGLVYRMPLQGGQGPVTVWVASRQLTLPDNAFHGLRTLKTDVKLLIAVIGGLAVLIIVLTGSMLSRKLSGSILNPLQKLRAATARVKEGSLWESIAEEAGDELGEACRDFDDMRLRLKQSVELQEKYEQERKQLIAGISHDLSTPLTSMKGYVSGLIDGIADTPEKQRHYLRTVYDTACDMEKLVESLLLFSKLDLGREEFFLETVDLGSYFADYCTEMEPLLERQGTRLCYQRLCPSPVLARIDRMQFGRVVSNLLDNSQKYRRPDVPVCISIAVDHSDGQAVLRFSDNGPGVAPDEAARLFDSFYRTDPARGDAVKGSGLGLSIARQIAEAMGGSIYATSNEGLTVTILLPLHEGGREGETL